MAGLSVLEETVPFHPGSAAVGAWSPGLGFAAPFLPAPGEPSLDPAPWFPSPEELTPAEEPPASNGEPGSSGGGQGAGPAVSPPSGDVSLGAGPRPAGRSATGSPAGPVRVVTPALTVGRWIVGLDATASAFRIARTPAGDSALAVRYALTAFSKAGPAGGERLAVISPGAAHVDVPNDPAPPGNPNGHEIVTITLREHRDYRIEKASATLFLAGDARRCSEAALLEAYNDGGSTEAFRALVERHRPGVLRACHQVLGNWHDAEDVSQIVFLALAQGQIRLQTTLAGWLRTVARNAAIVLLRSRNRRYRHEHRAAKPAVAAEEPPRDLSEELEAALARLAAPLRDAVRLRYLEGWSQVEAAQLLGCPRGTLAQRASLGVRRLGDILAQRNNLGD
jgi:RNA polymerase sigma factor (sigma-70 family)